MNFFYKGLKCVNLKERYRKQMHDQLKKKIQQSEKKLTALFKILLSKLKFKNKSVKKSKMLATLLGKGGPVPLS